MKKFVSILLCVVLIVGAMPFCLGVMAQENGNMCFAVASDLHYNEPREEFTNDIDDPVYFYANRRAAMDDESGFILDAFLKECAENSAIEFVLISGDLADNGRTIPQEHKDVAAKFKAFEEKTGKQIYVIDGNHDCGEGSLTTIENFKTIYADFGYNEALEKVDGTGSYTANLGSKYRLIALDSCDQTQSTEDGLTLDRLNWAVKQADKARDEGRYPILMMHHNLLDHMPVQRIFSHDFIVRTHFTTADILANHGIKLVLTGHEHCSDATSYISTAGNKIYDFATTSLSMYPLEYRIFNVTDNEIKYTSKGIQTLDFEGLKQACPDFTESQINLMRADLPAYAKGFLKAGVKYRLWLGLTMEKMGIKEEDFYYDLVYTAVSGLADMLERPLYGDGSVQEIAKAYNIDIPDSEYKNGWDLATDLVAAHYEGSENYPLDSTEVTILLRTVDLILLDDLSTVNDEVFLGAANSLLSDAGIDGICKSLTQLGTGVLGPVTAGEYFLLSVASPILYGFANDDDVDDNNGAIEGYGAENDVAGNLLAKISGIFEKIINFFRNLFVLFFK